MILRGLRTARERSGSSAASCVPATKRARPCYSPTHCYWKDNGCGSALSRRAVNGKWRVISIINRTLARQRRAMVRIANAHCSVVSFDVDECSRPRSPRGSHGCGLHRGTAHPRGYAPHSPAIGPSKLLKLCGCIRFGSEAQRRRRSCARAGAAAATCSCCWCCWPWPSGQLPVGGPLLDVTPSWSFAAVPRRCSGCVAPPQSSQSWTQA